MYGNKTGLILNVLSFTQSTNIYGAFVMCWRDVKYWGRVKSKTTHCVSLMEVRD